MMICDTEMENWDGGHETMGISIPERECFVKEEERSPKQLFVNVVRRERSKSKEERDGENKKERTHAKGALRRTVRSFVD
jgi:hypothetical protein